jgi:hydroxymethylglutaryl-CoA reductase (NADPH)
MFFPMMVLWSCCLAYFFGFFGISFVDTKVLSESPSTYGLQHLTPQEESEEEEEEETEQEQQAPASQAASASFAPPAQSFAQQFVPGAGFRTTVASHAPRADGPICSDKAPAAATAVAGEDVDYTALADEDVLSHLITGTLKDYQLEKKLGDYERAVSVRRSLYEHVLQKDLGNIPHMHYDYNKVFGANCEIVIGYVPIPLGIVGPLTINGEHIYVPMATTEGCLVASTNRGCKAISVAGGCYSVVMKDAITRAPCIRMPSAMRAAAVKRWVGLAENYMQLEAAFNSTTNYGKLASVEATVAGRNVYLRFNCMSGDAMGMNMVSKGCLKAIDVLQAEFPDLVLVAISGNMCTDKKPAAINWIMGRGKSIVVEAIIPESVVTSVLKSSVAAMIETNTQKNHIGSAMAGSVGGFNAHAANIVTAVYLATGQDPAQNVESSNCITIMEYAEDKKSLHVSVTMPSVEVGTVGGGTHLPAQANCLEICGVRGAAKGPGSMPGDNARKLAQIVGASVLAGELSLMAALAANQLVNSHMQHNRKPAEAPAADLKANTASMRKNVSMPDLGHGAAK